MSMNNIKPITINSFFNFKTFPPLSKNVVNIILMYKKQDIYIYVNIALDEILKKRKNVM